MKKPVVLLALSLITSAASAQQQWLKDKYKGTKLPDQSLKIVGGVKVREQKRMEVVAITHKSYGAFCTGTLVNPRLVITAAHCVDDLVGADKENALKSIRIYIGPGTEGGDFVGDIEVEDVGHHPLYMITPEGNSDTAFFKLKSPVTTSPVMPLLFEPEEVEASLKKGKEVSLIGFGYREHGGKDGRKYGVKHEAKSDIVYKTSQEIVIQRPGVDACNGDSGGPAIVRTKNGIEKVFGIVSRGPSICDGLKTAQWGLVHNSVCWMEEASGILLTREGFCADAKKEEVAVEDTFLKFCDHQQNQGRAGQIISALMGRYGAQNCQELDAILAEREEIDLASLGLKNDSIARYFKDKIKLDISFNEIQDISGISGGAVEQLTIMWNNVSQSKLDQFERDNTNTVMMGKLESKHNVSHTALNQACDKMDDMSPEQLSMFKSMAEYAEVRYSDMTMRKCHTINTLFNTEIYLEFSPYSMSSEDALKVDLSLLNGMELIQYLKLSRFDLGAVTGLGNMAMMKRLMLDGNKITDVSDLVTAINERGLGIAQSSIYLDLSNNPDLKDISAFENVKKRVTLDLIGTGVDVCVKNHLVTCQLPVKLMPLQLIPIPAPGLPELIPFQSVTIPYKN